MNNTVVIYCARNSPRLKYVLDWLFKEQLMVDYRLTHDEQEVSTFNSFISYGKDLKNALSIPDTGLLWEKDIINKEIKTGTWQNSPTLFADDRFPVPFDIFSAIFFLISRYEEYYTYTPDEHGRYPETESVLYKNGWLELPVIDLWIAGLRKLLSEQLHIALPQPSFKFQPTYDIDIAYSYKHKGIKRTVGAYLKDSLTGNIAGIAKRTRVLNGTLEDPYDSFEWICQLHKKHKTIPVYFILAALHTTAFDKNIDPSNPKMRALIKSFAAEGGIGLHPSYYSNTDSSIFLEEKNTIEDVAGITINISRQHYIRLNLPETYEQLIDHGISEDYSMGYTKHIGFRAATAQSFLWYNLKTDKVTELRVYPFCFMDTTARFEMKLTAEEGFERLNNMAQILKKTGSPLITIFHNFSLGTEPVWLGWQKYYALFFDEHAGANTYHSI